MEPTNATIIFYAVLAVAALFFVLCCARTKDDSIEMIWLGTKGVGINDYRLF